MAPVVLARKGTKPLGGFMRRRATPSLLLQRDRSHSHPKRLGHATVGWRRSLARLRLPATRTHAHIHTLLTSRAPVARHELMSPFRFRVFSETIRAPGKCRRKCKRQKGHGGAGEGLQNRKRMPPRNLLVAMALRKFVSALLGHPLQRHGLQANGE